MQGVAADGVDEWELRVPVLLYHRISAPPPGAPRPDEWVSPARFRAQLSALRDDGWTTMTAGQLAMALREGTPVGPKRFVITIDDGASDGWSHAAPILDELGMRATYCVVPGWAHRPGRLGSSIRCARCASLVTRSRTIRSVTGTSEALGLEACDARSSGRSD